ncbi:hypothetical protein JST56_06115 [Candidatus Dependentiae bacterium]|jgi:hypothetical protein|nr:hypothetical protein [Candidatus Dependentiae bacterium]
MDVWEFVAHIEFYFLSALETVLIQFLVEAAKFYLLTPHKGFIDGHMATIANRSKIKCPKCESVDRWNTISEITPNQVDVAHANSGQINAQEVGFDKANPNQENSEKVNSEEKIKQTQS